MRGRASLASDLHPICGVVNSKDGSQASLVIGVTYGWLGMKNNYQVDQVSATHYITWMLEEWNVTIMFIYIREQTFSKGFLICNHKFALDPCDWDMTKRYLTFVMMLIFFHSLFFEFVITSWHGKCPLDKYYSIYFELLVILS